MMQAAQRRIDLETLTKDNEAPMQVYLLERLCNSLAAANEDTNEDFAVLVTRKLQHSSSPHVLRKCLRLIEHACAKAENLPFRRAIQKHTRLIASLTRFAGADDPLYGDALNERVRAAATDAHRALVEGSRISSSTSSMSRTSAPSPRHNGASQSRSSIALDSVSSDDSAMQSAHSVRSAAASSSDTLHDTYVSASASTADAPQLSRGSQASKWGPSTTASPLSYDQPPTSADDTDASRNADQRFPLSAAIVQSTGAEQKIAHCAGDHPEYREVDQLCDSGGVKIDPPQKDIDHVLRSCRTLDPHRMSEAIQRCLRYDDPKVAARACTLLRNIAEAVAQDDKYSVIAQAFYNNIDEVHNILQSSNQAASKRAAQASDALRKCVNADPHSAVSQEPPAPADAQAAGEGVRPSLLDPEPSDSAEMQTATSATKSTDLLGAELHGLSLNDQSDGAADAHAHKSNMASQQVMHAQPQQLLEPHFNDERQAEKLPDMLHSGDPFHVQPQRAPASPNWHQQQVQQPFQELDMPQEHEAPNGAQPAQNVPASGYASPIVQQQTSFPSHQQQQQPRQEPSQHNHQLKSQSPKAEFQPGNRSSSQQQHLQQSQQSQQRQRYKASGIVDQKPLDSIDAISFSKK